MKKYQSLLYREFCITRKPLLTKAAVLGIFCLLTLVIAVYMAGNSSLENMNVTLAELCSITVMAISGMIQDADTFQADLASGWLRYSYTMPVTPKERTIVRELWCVGNTVLFGGVSILTTVLIHAILGVTCKPGILLYYFLILYLMLLTRTCNAAFVLKARNAEDVPPLTTKASYVCLGCGAVTAVLVLLVSGVSLTDLFGDANVPENFSLSERIPSWLLYIIVPVDILLIGLDAFFTYRNLAEATPSVQRRKPEKTGTDTLDLTAPHTELTGYLYKEFVQNKKNLLYALFFPFFTAALAVVMLAMLFTSYNLKADALRGMEGFLNALASPYVRAGIVAAAYLFVSGSMLYAFHDDNKKLWLYFVSTTPDGVKNFLYCKYVICFAMSGLFFVSCYVVDGLLATIGYFTTGEECAPVTVVALMLFLYSLIDNGFCIPLILRFGEKTGNIAALCAKWGMLVVIGLIALLLPDELLGRIIDVMIGMTEEDLGNVAVLLQGLFPWFAFGAYLLSYKISCKIFLKGVNAYVK